MTRKHHGRRIETTFRIKSTPQRVWEAWADPQHIANWFVDRAEGVGRAGTTMRWFFDTFGYVMDIPVIEAEPGKSFVVGGDDGPDGMPYLMEITITKDGGETVMNLVNSGFSEDPKKKDTFEGTVSGWQHALTQMKVWLERYPTRMRHHDLVVRPTDVSPERIRAQFGAAEARSRWLAPDLPADGEVLCDTGAEVMLAHSDGVLALKSFAMGPRRMIGLDWSVWLPDGAAPGDAKPRLTLALDRLQRLL